MLHHLIIQFTLYYLSPGGRLREVENKRKFQTYFKLYKWSRSHTRGDRLQEVPNISDLTGNVWYFGKLVAAQGEEGRGRRNC